MLEAKDIVIPVSMKATTYVLRLDCEFDVGIMLKGRDNGSNGEGGETGASKWKG